MIGTLREDNQEPTPISASAPINQGPGLSKDEASAELAVCNGPMPPIAMEKNNFQMTGEKVAGNTGDASQLVEDRNFFSNTIVPANEMACDSSAVSFKQIILPTDLMSGDDPAVPFAVALIKQSGGTLHAFHAFEVLPGETFASGIWTEASARLAGTRESRHKKLDQFATFLTEISGAKTTSTLVDGHPAVETIKFIKTVNADLIVLATHGRTGMPHWFLGSVAEKIIRLSSVPVLTVRPGATVSGELIFKTIILPTDFSENSDAAIPIAIALAKLNGAELILLHVIENTTYYGDPTWSVGLGPDVEQWTEVLRAEGEKKLAEAQAALSASSGIKVKAILKCGRADHEICAIAREEKADVVVMSTHGYTGFTHIAFGSVAERVLRTCPVPLLTIRAVSKPIKINTEA